MNKRNKHENKKILMPFLLITVLFVITVDAFGFHPVYKMKYLSIEALSEKETKKMVVLDLKERSIDLEIEGRTFLFTQGYVCDSIRLVHGFSEKALTALFDEKTKIHLYVKELLSVSEDSIWVAVRYGFGPKEHSYISMQVEETLQIARKDLNGILYSLGPPPVSSLYVGYTYNPKRSNHRSYHMVELGYNYTRLWGRAKTYNLYAANEFAFNPHSFFIGPKIGANASYYLAALGSEMIYYTDFNRDALYLRPYLAFSLYAFKISVGYNVPLCNKNQFNVNPLSLNICIPFYFF